MSELYWFGHKCTRVCRPVSLYSQPQQQQTHNDPQNHLFLFGQAVHLEKNSISRADLQ
jgi:hypothetical protein